MSTTDLSDKANGAPSDRRKRGNRRSASPDERITQTARPPIDSTKSTLGGIQLPWAPVLSNSPRLASAAIGAARHSANYASQLASIVTGGSAIRPKKGDRRFTDPTFTDHPLYRRIMQAYLALCNEVDASVAESNLQWKDQELLQFVAELVTSSLAPTNVLLGNPAALKRAFETCGASLVLGLRNYLYDLRFIFVITPMFCGGPARTTSTTPTSPTS